MNTKPLEWMMVILTYVISRLLIFSPTHVMDVSSFVAGFFGCLGAVFFVIAIQGKKKGE